MKINKEQQEMKRLSGLVTMTTVAKMKLQNCKILLCVVHIMTDLYSYSELRDTETTHGEALVELQKICKTMEIMPLAL